eukprot:gene3346-biopygen21111
MTDWGGEFPDLYNVLEIHEDASDEDILRAFRTQVMMNHPDKLGPLASGDERAAATIRMRVVLQAKNVLLDPASRTKYNEERNARKQGPQSESDFSAPEEASADMAYVWEIWAKGVIEGFAKQYDVGSQDERLIQVLGTILPPAIGGFKLGLVLATSFNTRGISDAVKTLSVEDQQLFFQALEFLCTKIM